MPGETIPITLEVIDNLTAAAGFPKAEAEISHFSESVTNMGKSVALAAAGFVGFEIGTKLLTNIAEQAIKTQESLVHLEGTLTALGQNFAVAGDAAERMVTQLKESSRFYSTDLRESLTRITQITDDFGVAMKLMPGIVQAATATHLPLENVVLAVGRAVEGSSNSLRRFGIIFDAETQELMKFMTAAQRADVVMGEFHKRFPESEHDLQSWAAQVERARNEVKEAESAVGSFFATLVGHAAMGLAGGPGTGSLSEFIKQFLAPFSAVKEAVRGQLGIGDVSSTAKLAGISDISPETLERQAKEAAQREKDHQAALAESARLTAVYQAELEKLTTGVKDHTAMQKALDTALRMSAEGFEVNWRAVENLGKRMNLLREEVKGVIFDLAPIMALTKGTATAGGLSGADLAAFNAGLPFGQTEAEKGVDLFNKQLFDKVNANQLALEHGILEAQGEADDEHRRRMLQTAQDAGKLFVQNAIDSLSTGLAGLLSGQGFGGFKVDLGGSIRSILDATLGGIFGVTKDSGTGKFSVPGVQGQFNTIEEANRAAAAAQTSATSAGGLGVIGVNFAQGIGAGLGTGRGVSDLSTAASAVVGAAGMVASLAATYGSLIAIPAVGWIAAAALAVGQIVGKLLQPSVGADYQYGIPGISGGQSFLGPGQNIDAAGRAQIIAQQQKVFDDTVNSFNALLIHMGQAGITPSGINVRPVVGRFEEGASFGGAPSAGYPKELQEYFTTTLPQKLADMFFKPLAAAFDQFGFTDARFKQIFDSLKLVDPKAARDALIALGEGAMEIFKAIQTFKTPTGFGANLLGPDILGIGSTLSGQAATPSATAAFGTAFQNIIDLANIAKDAIGPEQLNDWKAVGDAMKAVQQQELDFVKQLNSAIQSSTQSWNQMISQFHLAGMVDAQGRPDYAAQVKYLKSQADLVYQAIGSAPDIATVQYWQSYLMSIINQIVSIGGQEGPGAAKGFAAWGEAVAAQGRDAVIARLKALGAELDQTNKDFIAKFQPIWDAYSKQLTDSSTHITNLGDSADHATTAIAAMADAATAAADALGGIAGGGGGGGGTSDASFVADTRARVVASR